MATQFYTDEILDANFEKMTGFSSDVLDAMQSLTTLAERTEVRLQVLEQLSRRPTVVKTSKLFLLTVVALSVYAGYKYTEEKYKDELNYLKSRTDHPVGSKINGNHSPNEN